MFFGFKHWAVKKLSSFMLILSFLFLSVNVYAVPISEDRFLYFGRYPQNKITDISSLVAEKDYIELNGSFYKLDPIKWKIIQEDDTSLLVVSENNLDVKPFCAKYSDTVSWINSDITKWLNSSPDLDSSFCSLPFTKNGLLYSAFTEAERDNILPSSVSYIVAISLPFSRMSKPVKCFCTQKIFLLSQDDLSTESEFGINNPNINAQNTDFVNSYEVSTINNYWLRDTLSENTLLDSFETAFCVNSNGKFETKWVERDACVRPAMRINKSVVMK